MSSSERNNKATWSVSQVLERVPNLGIPHFQRGLVWGNESRAALLESLYYDTPCGSFVLWAPQTCRGLGVPLDPSVSTDMSYLVIDGQQRIRSLHAIFHERQDDEVTEDDTDGTDDTEEGAEKVWCINLARVPGFADKLEPQAREYSMFIKTLDPKKRKARNQASPLLFNLIPLRVVESAESWMDSSLEIYRDLVKRPTNASAAFDAELAIQYANMRAAVLAMRSREFFVSIQRQGDPSAMAELYNRINAGGKRVEIEERAFARLVGLKANTYEELARVFETVHGSLEGQSNGKDKERQDRDQVLRRQQERAFGFRLFIRVFLQVCQHHLGFRQGRSEYSLELANKDYFLTAFRGLNADQVEFLWQETRRVLGHTRDVLRDELHCDDLRTLPDANSLTPIFQLLIHFPELGQTQYRALLAGLSLRLLLAEVDSRTLLRLLHDAADPSRVAFDVIAAMLNQLNRATERGRLTTRLEQANSIQHRYVWLLYWLERRLGARDFLYAHVPGGGQLTPPERLVERKALPEKQHLVAFNKAGPMYGSSVNRSSSHPVNSLGNLTYISHALNTFDGGLGEFLPDLAVEPLENQLAHLLVGGESERYVLDDYERLRESLNSKGARPREKDKETFERMLRNRRQIIRDGFLAWIDDLDREVADRFKLSGLEQIGMLSQSEHRIEPAAPLFAPIRQQNVAHVIRRLGLDHAAEDRVVTLARHAARVPSRKDDKPDRELWLTKKRKRVWVAARPGAVTLGFSSDLPQEYRQEVLEALELGSLEEEIPNTVPLQPVPDFGKLIELMKKLGPELEEKTPTSAHRWEERERFWQGFIEYLGHRPNSAVTLERAPKQGMTTLAKIAEGCKLKGKISVALGTVEIYLRLKGPSRVARFEALFGQCMEIEKALGAEVYWRSASKGENYQIGLQREASGTGQSERREQFEWLSDMATRFSEVFGPRLSSIDSD